MKHKAKPSGSSGGNRLRLTILLATVAAFLLVPAAQAFAGTLTINVEGSGNGEVSSVGGLFGEGKWEGSPPIECSHVGSPVEETTGVCETELVVEEEFDAIAAHATADPGSEFAGWETVEGFGAGCSEVVTNPECTFTGFGGNAEATAIFVCETEGGCEEETGPELTVVKEGTGTGTVVSNPAGIECGATCSAAFEESTVVTLTASPAAGSAFTSWKGCGTVEGRKCTVTMSAAKTVGAKFSPTYNVTVKKTTGSTGLGAVSGVACDASCSSATAAFLVGKAVKLTPKASKGSAFTEWSSCPGTIVEVNKCEMTSAGTAEVKFTAIPKYSLTVNKTGGGQGKVTSKPASINCSLTCSTQTSSFQEGTEVELTASVTAGKGSSFGGWSGGGGTCSGLTNPCKMPAITGTQSVTAEFK